VDGSGVCARVNPDARTDSWTARWSLGRNKERDAEMGSAGCLPVLVGVRTSPHLGGRRRGGCCYLECDRVRRDAAALGVARSGRGRRRQQSGSQSVRPAWWLPRSKPGPGTGGAGPCHVP
jgi:hypothetical protein